MPRVTVRFYGALNDFLPPPRRHRAVECAFVGTRSVKDLAEGLGVPHPEIALIVVGGEPVDFSRRVADGERVAIYPPFEQLDLAGLPGLQSAAPAEPRFVADVHLGRLAAYLRLAGFDTDYDRDRSDPEIAGVAETGDRTVLTRDVGLLMHRRVRHGYFVRSTQPARQLVEVLRRFRLAARAEPFSRCLRCNARLARVPGSQVEALLPDRIRQLYEQFSRCPGCGRVYWAGSHYERMRRLVDVALAAAGHAGHPS